MRGGGEAPQPAAAVRHGWHLYAHPAFRLPFDALVAEVERLRQREPDGYRSHPKAKLLARLLALVTDEIPRDPSSPEYAQGNTLGPAHRHWRRAKFLGRFRLFFRYAARERVIVYAWVNDESSLRKAGARTDPYQVFADRLRRGDPPDGWDELLREAEAASPPFAPDAGGG